MCYFSAALQQRIRELESTPSQTHELQPLHTLNETRLEQTLQLEREKTHTLYTQKSKVLDQYWHTLEEMKHVTQQLNDARLHNERLMKELQTAHLKA